ncbi:MAG: DUF2283 domain-containing protein [Nanoarchaeota archaeon]
MKIRHDPEADAMYIYVKKSEIDSTIKIDSTTLIDIDKKGEIVGIELLSVKDRNPKLIGALRAKNMLQKTVA